MFAVSKYLNPDEVNENLIHTIKPYSHYTLGYYRLNADDYDEFSGNFGILATGDQIDPKSFQR